MLFNLATVLSLVGLASAAALTDDTVSYFRDCAEIKAAFPGQSMESGAYTIYVGDGREPVDVYCDMTTDRGGWTVIQRRVDGKVDFYRNWTQYVNGFGDISGEFWLGLTYIHSLTSQKTYQLHIEMKDWSDNSAYAGYSNFVVAGADCLYTLTSIGTYCGNAGDSLAFQLNQKFTTYDRDNDMYADNCAVIYKGAWWYNNCHASNLNGHYYIGGVTTTYADGLDWSSWKGHYYSLKFVEMKVRPPNY